MLTSFIANRTPLFLLIKANLIAAIVVTLTTTIAHFAGWVIENITLIEYVAVYCGYMGTWLATQRSRMSFIFAFLCATALLVLFFRLEVYASATVQAILLPIIAYGFYKWRNNASEGFTPSKPNPLIIALLALSAVAMYFVSSHFDGKLPLLDSVIFFLTLMAQYLMALRQLANWFLWNAVNLVGIYLYYHAGAYLTTLQYIYFLGNASYGFYAWRKSRSATRKKATTNTSNS